jgi:hypothetical protein
MQNKCLNCESITARKTYKYCSNKCQAEYQYNKYIKEWLEGKIDGGTSSGIVSRHVKKYLREINKNKCEICGWSELNVFTGIIPLEADHIDGNHKNNKINNLRLICPNCHALTSTYKALNKGNGRSWRMPS